MNKETFIVLFVAAIALIAVGTEIIVNAVETNVKAAYVKGLLDGGASCDCSLPLIDTTAFDQGYSKAITDTQNATLLVGYCAAQQEAVKNGFLLANNSTLVTPTSILKSICFR